jgi:hypothetical protein
VQCLPLTELLIRLSDLLMNVEPVSPLTQVTSLTSLVITNSSSTATALPEAVAVVAAPTTITGAPSVSPSATLGLCEAPMGLLADFILTDGRLHGNYIAAGL